MATSPASTDDAGNVTRIHARTVGTVAGSAEEDPYHVQVPTDELCRLAGALDVVDEHAALNYRYRKLIRDSREVLGAERIRLTQARGVAKRLMVLVKAAGPELPAGLGQRQRDVLQNGLAQADELVYGS